MSRASKEAGLRNAESGRPSPSGDAAPEKARSDPPAAETVAARLEAIERMDYAALRAEWRRLYRVPPPKRVGRDLLVLGVAWKIQEQAYGGLGAATRRRLADLARILERDGDVPRNRVTRLRPGARLLRTWRGETHRVLVLEDGFEWRGVRWRSLSAIAREITGAQWSGPRFFGVTGRSGIGAGTRSKEPADG